MKLFGHRFAFSVAAVFLAFAGKGDDAVGVMRIDAGTNSIVEAEMSFDSVGGEGNGLNEKDIIDGVKDFAKNFSSGWSCPFGQNCHEFAGEVLEGNCFKEQ